MNELKFPHNQPPDPKIARFEKKVEKSPLKAFLDAIKKDKLPIQVEDKSA